MLSRSSIFRQSLFVSWTNDEAADAESSTANVSTAFLAALVHQIFFIFDEGRTECLIMNAPFEATARSGRHARTGECAPPIDLSTSTSIIALLRWQVVRKHAHALRV